ncbi:MULTISPECIES: DEAD/DEAH box helicase [unclassified Clostridium]|uniref:DEAD/DEAH box helicase n=1 Tax=unclassified Clostridium TaxID=2614128 RepID=UPI0009610179|nr:MULTISPECIES: DEAD/DEAH box helicase [unclassified Clostridium]MEE0566877.1 DEAD/DEAH box helicase [Clostridium sp.]OKZ85630.1 MAG: helicase [Clostridium sp. 29_15]
MNKSFNELNINQSIVMALKKQNITTPTGIQETSIPFALENKDIIAEAHTGTGKTLAFLIPIFEKINLEKREMQAIILAPTHELVVQIESQIKLLATNSHMDIKSLSIMGESNIEKQIKKLKEIKPHIIIGSPGRILDLIKKRKITAHTIKTIVLDEADNLLSKNKPTIIKDIIKSTMKDRQLMFFSASINKETLNLAKTLVKEVEIIKIENKSEINPRIEHICILGSLRDRFENLRKLLAAEQPKRAIVFVNNNTELRQINEKLQYHKVKSTAIYGNASKEERQRALDSFRRGKCNVLVSSDLSARGLDIPEVSHIISLDFPVNPNEYLHRAGRTARGNNSGVSLCLITNKDIEILQSYEKAFGIEFTVKKLYGGKLMDMEQQ